LHFTLDAHHIPDGLAQQRQQGGVQPYEDAARLLTVLDLLRTKVRLPTTLERLHVDVQLDPLFHGTSVVHRSALSLRHWEMSSVAIVV
jgi:hypothetical protein